jgi:hypothetical protein
MVFTTTRNASRGKQPTEKPERDKKRDDKPDAARREHEKARAALARCRARQSRCGRALAELQSDSRPRGCVVTTRAERLKDAERRVGRRRRRLRQGKQSAATRRRLVKEAKAQLR